MPARRREAWNDEDIATLRRMVRADEPTAAIARALERSEAGIRTMIGKLGLPRRTGASVRG